MIDRLFALRLALLALYFILPSMAWSQAGDEATNDGIQTVTPYAATSPLEYWTAERMRNATPKEAPEPTPEEQRWIEKNIAGPSQTERRQPNDNATLPRLDLTEFGAPNEADVSANPYRHAGKLHFTMAGKDHGCTAQFVGDLTVLLTAAHCIRDAKTGEWATNVVFHRGYNNGPAQQRVETACLSTKHGWVTAGANRYKWDYAFIKTSSPSNSGHFGVRLFAPEAEWQAIGYPSNFGSGRIMMRVQGMRGSMNAGVVQMLGNPMRHGNSGGAWHISGYVVGNNSKHTHDDTTTEWSPYYDAHVLGLWRFALNGCAEPSNN